MTWFQRHRAQRYIADSIWIFPVLSIAVALGAVLRLLKGV